jgi:hypothetical protein
MITPMKRNLRVDSTEGPPIAADPINAGVLEDLRVTLSVPASPGASSPTAVAVTASWSS